MLATESLHAGTHCVCAKIHRQPQHKVVFAAWPGGKGNPDIVMSHVDLLRLWRKLCMINSAL
jgi:hypothetical protein